MERLTSEDLMMLEPDRAGWPQDIGVLAVLDAGPLVDAEGRFRLAAARAVVLSRLHLIPRFRQRLYRPRRPLGWPLWVDAADFDIADHVDAVAVPAPADEERLLDTVEGLRRRRLDRGRPRWRMWFLTGLPEHRVGLYITVHHAIADGAAGLAILGALLDESPDRPAAAAPPFRPAPIPPDRALFVDNLGRRVGELSRFAAALVRPAGTLRRWRAAWPTLRETLAGERAPRSSLNRTIGPGRRFVLIRDRLDPLKRVAHRHDATVNDVLLAAIAGGLRPLLRGRGERVDDLVLRAYVPVSLHRERAGPARGNHDGVMAVSLPVGVADPVARLRLIAAQTAQRRRRSRPTAGTLLRTRAAQRLFVRLMARQRWANVYLANVTGPPRPRFFAGSPVLELFPIVPLTGNITVGVGALSYAGRFAITVVADRDACPDVAVFAAGVRAALRSLTAGVLAPG